MEIKLRLPVKYVSVNQPFGANFVDFYQKLGMLGHNGIDFKTKRGCLIHATHNGKVTFAWTDGDGGVAVYLLDEDKHYQTVYYHLDEVLCQTGDIVLAGDIIGKADNTGKMTTGDHLHFWLKFLDDSNFNSLNYNNGYKGSVNPADYFAYNYLGETINPKDYDKSRCYHRYYRGRPKGGLFNEIKILGILGKKGIYPTAEKINALVYGGWDLQTVQNEAAYEIWSSLKKSEYLEGLIPFKE